MATNEAPLRFGHNHHVRETRVFALAYVRSSIQATTPVFTEHSRPTVAAPAITPVFSLHCIQHFTCVTTCEPCIAALTRKQVWLAGFGISSDG
jgi:hypothetical protein